MVGRIWLNILNKNVFHNFYLEILIIRQLYNCILHIMVIYRRMIGALNTLGTFYNYKNCRISLTYRSSSTLNCMSAVHVRTFCIFSYLDYSFFYKLSYKMYDHLFLVKFLSSFAKIFRIGLSFEFKSKTGEKLNFQGKIILQLNTFFKSIISCPYNLKDQEIFSKKWQKNRDLHRGKIIVLTLKKE